MRLCYIVQTKQIVLIVLFILKFSFCDLTVAYNYTNIIKYYYLMCGPEYMCDESKADFTHLPNISYGYLELCPECSCNNSCILLENCCADIFFQLPDQSCENTVILDSTGYKIYDQFPMVKNCPISYQGDANELCLRNRTIVEKILFSPVTSSHSQITYLNKYCAVCNGEENITRWDLNISCYLFSDFNYLSTYQQVVDQAMARQCTIRYEPYGIPVRVCSSDSTVYYSKCNMTGFWHHYDSDIQYACESTYGLKYKVFKNIFCYLCNPIRSSNREVIENCNETDLWIPGDSKIEDACTYNDFNEGRYPFKNVFCLLCNRNNANFDRYQDVKASVAEYIRGDLFIYRVSIHYFKIPYYDILLQTQNGNANESASMDIHFNITNVLLQTYARNPSTVGVCNKELLPPDALEIVRTKWKNCSCNPKESQFNLCMDILLKYPKTCISNVVQFGLLNRTPEVFYAVTSGCYENKYMNKINKRCIGKAKDVYSFLPVTDQSSGIQYKNFDCFMCNQFSNTKGNKSLENFISPDNYYLPLDLRIFCHRSYVDFAAYIFLYDVIEIAKKSQCRISFSKNSYMKTCIKHVDIVKHCNTTGNWPVFDPDINWLCEELSEASFDVISVIGSDIYKNAYCFQCNPDKFQGDVITSCNTTGLWEVYDENVEKGCHTFPTIFNYPPYKNKFCQICNIKPCRRFFCKGVVDETFSEPYGCELEPFDCKCNGPGCVNPLDIPGVKIRNLFRIEEFNNKKRQEMVLKCSEDQIFDQIQGICRNLTCFPGKYLYGTKCVPLFPITSNLRYTIEFDVEGILPRFNNIHSCILNSTLRNISPWISQLITSASVDTTNLFVMQVELFSSLPCTIDDIISTNTSVSIHASVNFFIKSPLYRYELEKRLLEINGLPFEFTQSLNYIKDFKVYKTGKTLRINETIENGNLESCRRSVTDTESLLSYGEYRSTFVSRQLICRQIELEPDEYIYNQRRHELYLDQHKIRLDSEQFIIDPDNKARVCVDDILPKMSRSTKISKSSTELALEIMTTVCSCVSMLCLLLTFVTYSCFNSLRTLPGKNNMCLIFALFVAQTCLQFGTIWTNHVIVCKIIGVVLHIFWLATFGCMNVCSFHMYSVFKTLKPMGDNLDDNKRLVQYILYSFGVPVLIVVINIAVHLGLSEGRSIGYGKICFISSKLSQIISFISPVILICVANIWLFSVTAYKIRSRPKVQSTKSSKNDFFVYVKLFALTGITWIGQVIDSFFPLSPFSFVVTLLTGLQGFFIFLSYVCNNRTLKLYSNAFKVKDPISSRNTEISSRSADRLSSNRCTQPENVDDSTWL